MPPKTRARGAKATRGGEAKSSRAAGTKRVPARSTVGEESTQRSKRAKPNNSSSALNRAPADGDSDRDEEEKRIEVVAKKYWLGNKVKWSPEVVDELMKTHIVGKRFSRGSLRALERLQYFERYLWANFVPDTASDTQVISMLVMLNEKHQEKLASTLWASFASSEEETGGSDSKAAHSFSAFFDCVVDLALNKILKQSGGDSELVGGVDQLSARSILTQFLIACFSSLETPFVRDSCMKLVSLSIWHHVDSEPLVETEFARTPQLRKFWKHLNKKLKPGKKNDAEEVQRLQNGRDFLSLFIKDFLAAVFSAKPSDKGCLAYGAKFLELLVDLESQLPTRRYVNILVVDHQVIDLCQLSSWYREDQSDSRQAQRFRELVVQLRKSVYFQVNDVTGQALTEAEAKDAHYNRLVELQAMAYKEFPKELEDLAVSSVAKLGEPDVLTGYLGKLSDESLLRFASLVGVRTHSVLPTSVKADFVGDKEEGTYSRQFVVGAIAERYKRRPTVADQVREISPYPTETLLFDEIIRETDQYGKQPMSVAFSVDAQDEESAETKGAASINYPVLAVPKLNLQFLSLHDYLARNFDLFRLESAYEIREDVEDAVRRLQPRMTYDSSADATVAGGQGVDASTDVNNTHFSGWARMAVPIHSFGVVDVQRPRIGETAPSRVRADVSIDLGNHVESIRQEWATEVRPKDVLILIAVQATGHGDKGSAGGHLGIKHIRGGEVECKLDINGKPIDEFANRLNPQETRADREAASSSVCSFRLLLDPNQYYSDTSGEGEGQDDVYATFNVVMRRRPQENNFKAVLETVRDLMLAPQSLPSWLSSTFLGYGDPAAATALSQRPLLASSSSEEKEETTESVRVNFGDTFMSEEHLRESFSEYGEIAIDDEFAKPCIVEFPVGGDEEKSKTTIRVSSKPAVDMGPLELSKPRENAIRFTPAQVSAIHSASLPGLTLVVGPPGTGKTDVAVQIISNLYHAFPKQNILLITHSNQALNQLFEKIIALDIEPRHLLRLGHGEEELDAEERYSKAGRVESYLERRRELLDQVQTLAESMGVHGDFGYTCETARLFFVSHVRVRWELYRRRITGGTGPNAASPDDVVGEFPFAQFFAQALGRPLFDGAVEDVGRLVCAAEGCYRHIESIFDELGDIQPFELLRTNHERSNYLLTNQARIVAMTCTHAALKRRELIRLGFRYDNVVMEEAAQVLDIETFIPLALQPTTQGSGAGRRLKRVVMIGDHNQLPPVVKNSGLRAYANMEQSLFTRMVRLGVPYIELNKQARARPEIASLYRGRYQNLGDLEPQVTEGEFAQRNNSGFKSVFQFVDVADFQGKGETEPTKYYYQNLGEAEYVVAVYQYMRLLGYPAQSIAILTTYNGQRALIRDVLERRCGWLEYFGRPRAISTVDQYQGQQSDYVLLSLVRTRAVGHVRDLRRLTVALSRARLGLYVFGRRSVFETCFELQAPMRRLLENGDRLALCPEEQFGAGSSKDEDEDEELRKERAVWGVVEMGQIVFGMIEKYVEAHGTAPVAAPAAGNESGEDEDDDEEAEKEANGVLEGEEEG